MHVLLTKIFSGTQRIFNMIFLSLIVFIVTLSISFAGNSYWEPRTIDCRGSEPNCVIKNKEGDIVNNKCRFETDPEDQKQRYACALKVSDARRDSASLKRPPNAHQCIRYYSYNDYKGTDDWYMWVKPPCTNATVTIWYFFAE